MPPPPEPTQADSDAMMVDDGVVDSKDGGVTAALAEADSQPLLQTSPTQIIKGLLSPLVKDEHSADVAMPPMAPMIHEQPQQLASMQQQPMDHNHVLPVAALQHADQPMTESSAPAVGSVVADSDDDSDEEGAGPGVNGSTSMTDVLGPAGILLSQAAANKQKNARVSCHQCKTTKDDGLLLFCTTKAEKGKRKRKCRKKYCDACLRRSYNMSISGLTPHEVMTYCCPACTGACSCAACQRKQLESLVRKENQGVRTNPASFNGGSHVARPVGSSSQSSSPFYNIGGAFLASMPSSSSSASHHTTEVAVAVAAVPVVASAAQPVTAAALQAQLQTQMHAHPRAHAHAALVQAAKPYMASTASMPDGHLHATVLMAQPGTQPSTHATLAPAPTVASTTLSPVNSAASSQPSVSPSSASVSSGSSLVQGLAQLTTSPRSSHAAVTTMKEEHAAIKAEASALAASHHASLPLSETQTIALAQQAAAATAASTQAEIEEKTRQLQELLQRRMSQDPNFLATLAPSNPLSIIRNMVVASQAHARGHSSASNSSDPEHWVEASSSHHRLTPVQEAEERNRRLKYEMQMRNIHTAEASIHSALSTPPSKRRNSAASNKKRGSVSGAAGAGGPPTPRCGLAQPTKSRAVTTGSIASATSAGAGMTTTPKTRARAPRSTAQPRAPHKICATPHSPYQRPGSASSRRSPALHVQMEASSAPSSVHTSPALRGMRAQHLLHHQIPMHQDLHLDAMVDEEMMDTDDLHLEQSHHYHQSPPRQRHHQQQHDQQTMPSNDPNYHRWLQRQHAQLPAHEEASYGRRVIQAHKHLLAQQQQQQAQHHGSEHVQYRPQHQRNRSHQRSGDFTLPPPQHHQPQHHQHNQQPFVPNVNVDHARESTRYANLLSPQGGSYSPITQSNGGGGLFSPIGNGPSNGGLFTPQGHTSQGSIFSPQQPPHHQQSSHLPQQPQHQQYPSQAQQRAQHHQSAPPVHVSHVPILPQLSIGLHHPPHNYVITSPDGVGGSDLSALGSAGGSSGFFGLPTPNPSLMGEREVSSLASLNQLDSFSPLVSTTSGREREPSAAGGNSSSFLFTPLPGQHQHGTGHANHGIEPFDWSTAQGLKASSTSSASPAVHSPFQSIHGSTILGMLSPNGGIQQQANQHQYAMQPATPIYPHGDGALPMLPTA